jgi:hypothetical protein
MDIDFADLAYYGDGSSQQLVTLFDKLAETGFEGAIIDCFYNGQSLYHSDIFPRFSNPARVRPYARLIERLKEFDPLSFCLQLASERNLKLFPYVRLTDEAFAPSHADPMFRRNPHYWYQTRCGGYPLFGVPCFAYEEVRNLFRRRCDDLIAKGVTGLFIGTCRSHAGVIVPYVGQSGWDIWGFNPPIVAEYRRRYGTDIGSVGNVVVRNAKIPGYRQIDYEGVEPVDESKFRALLGEGVDCFLRDLHTQHSAVEITVEMSTGAVAPGVNNVHNLFTLDMRKLIADGVVTGWMPAENWRCSTERLEDIRHVIGEVPPGTKVGAWLNDLLSPDGGDSQSSPVTASAVQSYLRRAETAGLDTLMVHEAFYLLAHPAASDIWDILASTFAGR